MEAVQPSIGQLGEKWYALRVKARSEQRIAKVARNKGYEEFVPVYKYKHRWSDRLKVLERPLFPGYVFCRLNPRLRLPLLTIPGVLHFVAVRNSPVAIDDAEMTAIQIATQSGLSTEPCPYVEGGRAVRLHRGPLAKLEGLLVESRDRYRLIISLSPLRLSAAIEIDESWVRSPGIPKTTPDIFPARPV